MRRLAFTESARVDLKTIRRYSVRTWGAERTALYMTSLSTLMKGLVTDTIVSRGRDDLRPGLRMAVSGRHCVFFEADSSRVLVLRVLHERMDYRRHLDAGKVEADEPYS